MCKKEGSTGANTAPVAHSGYAIVWLCAAVQVMADSQLEYSVLPKLVKQALKQQQEARKQLQQQARVQQLAQ
jgi:hypothetical protein